MPENDQAGTFTEIEPARIQQSSPLAIHDSIARKNLPRTTPADLGMDRVSLTYLDSTTGQLEPVAAIIPHDTLNQILSLIEDRKL